MKKERMFGILILVTLVLSAPLKAGWIGDFGRRIIEGAKNAAQNNVQNKINRSIDNAMDGKLGKQQKSTNSTKGKNEYQGNPERSSSKSGSAVEYEKIDSSGMLDLSVVKRRALPITGKYQEIDLGTFKFQGERLYGETLHMGEQAKDLDFYLLPGSYLITFSPRSYNHDVSVTGKHEGESIEFGYGINLKRYIENNGLYSINGNKGGTALIIDVSKNGGHFEMLMFNDQSKGGALEFSIFKIPD